MPAQAAILSLSGGEISPLLYNRIDLEKRASSLAYCENFLPLPYGGLRKRPGTRHLMQITTAGTKTQLIPFRGSDGIRYMIAFDATHITAYRIEAGSSHTFQTYFPLTNDDLPFLRWTVLNDVIFFAHPQLHPFTLRYTGPTSWAIERVTYQEAPMLDLNLEEDAIISVTESGVSEWVTATSYTAGNKVIVTRDGQRRQYVCTVNHTSGTTTRPGIGKDWRLRWNVSTIPAGTTVNLDAFPGITTWANSTAYRRGDYVTQSGIPYRCRIAHTSTTGLTPGPDIDAYWRRVTDPFRELHEQGTGVDDEIYRPAASFALEIRREERNVTSEIRAITGLNGTFSTPILISGSWNFNTFGTWSGIFEAQRSLDGGTTYETVAVYESEGDRNYAESYEEEKPALIRIGFTSDGGTGSNGQQRAVVTPAELTVRGRYIVQNWNNDRQITALTQDQVISGSTNRWQESAFNRRNGYPRALTIHERRLYYAGTPLRPLDLWASRIEDFAYFRTGTKDDDAMKVTLGANSQNPILWLASQRRLTIGTRLSEWVIGSENNDNPTTPTNFLARQYTTYGSSENCRPLLIGDSLVFLQRHDQRIREMGFVAERETYDATDLTRLAEHLLMPDLKITSMAWQESREPTLWCTVSDGTLRCLTYIRAERIFAWSRHRTAGGSFRTVAVSPNDGIDDEVFFIVQRGSNYYLELIPANAQQLNEQGPTSGTATSAAAPAVLDSQSNATTTLTAHSRWGGLGKYYPFSDAATQEKIRELATGSTPPTANSIGGIPITATFTTLPLEMETQTGSSIGRYKTVHKVRACLYLGRDLECAEHIAQAQNEASPCFVPMKPTREDTRIYGAYERATATAPALIAGWVEANVSLNSLNLSATFRHTSASPCTITALVIEANVSPA